MNPFESIHLSVIPEIKDGELSKFLRPGQEKQEEMAKIEAIGCLPGGMVSGLPAFVIVIALPNGDRVVAETSWRNMSLGMVALIGVWGTP